MSQKKDLLGREKGHFRDVTKGGKLSARAPTVQYIDHTVGIGYVIRSLKLYLTSC